MKLMIASAMVLAFTSSYADPAQRKKEVTELSKKADQLKHGTTRAEVIRLLGTPTWAILPTDKGEWELAKSLSLELRWSNGNCNNVAVSFDRTGKLTGSDAGRAVCFDKFYPLNPPDELSCKRKDRA